MMGQIDDSVAFGHGTPVLCPSLQEAAFCGRVDDRTDAYLHLPHWSLSKTRSKQNASEKGDVQGIPGRVSRNPQKSRWLSLSTPCVKTGFVPKLLSRLGRDKSEGAGC